MQKEGAWWVQPLGIVTSACPTTALDAVTWLGQMNI